jgi:drug/metabolite transporter (DMT)-like permease
MLLGLAVQQVLAGREGPEVSVERLAPGDPAVPLGRLVVVTGVSGSGKSTLAARLAAAKTSLLALLEVVFGIALTWLFGGETPSWATVAGGLAVLAALAYNEVGQSRRPATAA